MSGVTPKAIIVWLKTGDAALTVGPSSGKPIGAALNTGPLRKRRGYRKHYVHAPGSLGNGLVSVGTWVEPPVSAAGRSGIIGRTFEN